MTLFVIYYQSLSTMFSGVRRGRERLVQVPSLGRQGNCLPCADYPSFQPIDCEEINHLAKLFQRR